MRFRNYFFILALAIAAPARAGVLTGEGIGVYGDSMSMQYSFWLPLAPQFNYSVFYNGTQWNWVDLLEKNGYNFGPPTSLLGETLNSYDVAVSGQASADLPTQVSNLQPFVSAGNVGLVVEMIGANDVNSPEYSTVYNNAANHSYNPLTDPGVQSFMDTVIANMATSITSTLAENPATKMILATIPDVGVTPLYQAEYPNATQRSAMTVVTQALNQQILALAAQYHFPVVDMFALSQRSLTPLTVGGVNMKDAGGDGGKNEYLSDGFHPSTVIQGLMGNAILMADNLAYHDPVTYLTDQYILTEAGVSHNNQTSYFDVSPYVIVPEPSTLMLASLGLTALLSCRWRRA